MTTLPARAPRLSHTEMTELVLPQHANRLGTAFGGTLMSWIDICGAITAQRHCGRIAVTAGLDELAFRAPVRVGDIVVLKGRVNAAFRTSVEVEVRAEREHPQTRERTPCVDALLTFVNVDENGTPAPVPPLVCETDEERALELAAQERRQARLRRKHG